MVSFGLLKFWTLFVFYFLPLFIEMKGLSLSVIGFFDWVSAGGGVGSLDGDITFLVTLSRKACIAYLVVCLEDSCFRGDLLGWSCSPCFGETALLRVFAFAKFAPIADLIWPFPWFLCFWSNLTCMIGSDTVSMTFSKVFSLYFDATTHAEKSFAPIDLASYCKSLSFYTEKRLILGSRFTLVSMTDP